MSKNVRLVFQVDAGSFSGYELEGSIHQVIEKLTKMIDPNIKDQYIEHDYEYSGYGDGTQRSVFYLKGFRDETDEEMEKRLETTESRRKKELEAKRVRKIKAEAKEKELYETLKKKYG